MNGQMDVPKPVVVAALIAVILACGAFIWAQAGTLRPVGDVRALAREFPPPTLPPVNPGNDMLMMGGPKPDVQAAVTPSKKSDKKKKP